MFGAIIVVGAEGPANGNSGSSARSAQGILRGGSLAGVEVLGRSLLEATVENLQSAGIGPISLLASSSAADGAGLDQLQGRFLAGESLQGAVEFFRVEDIASTIGQKLNDQRNSGIDTTVVMYLGAYVELGLIEAMRFHQEQRNLVTRLSDVEGLLDIWMLETSHFATRTDILNSLHTDDSSCAVSGYVNRLASPRDLRRLAIDALTGRCRLRPLGREIQPGFWVGEGAQVHRGARVIAPAFIGRGSIIGKDCTIENCSAVESDCEVDYGSTLSDVSLLPNTYVGIGLDICHSVVSGGTLLSLEHNVTLEIGDAGVARFNKVLHQDVIRQSPANVEVQGMLFTPAEEAAN